MFCELPVQLLFETISFYVQVNIQQVARGLSAEMAFVV